MKKLSILLVSAFFAYTTTATAQTVKKTDKQTTNKKGKTVTVTPVNTQDYATAHKSPIDSYKEQTDNTQQGATADNGEEAVTVNQVDKGDKPVTKTKTMYKKTSPAVTTTSSKKVVKP